MSDRTDVASLLARSAARAGSACHHHLNPALHRLMAVSGMDRAFTRGEGPYLWDSEGTQSLDCLAGFGALLLGRGHPRVTDALVQCIQLAPPAWVRFSPNGLAAEAAGMLKAMAGRPDDRVYFTNSGTEAVESAIKFARRHTGRSGVVGWDDGFHGFTLGSLSVSGNRDLQRGFGDLVPGCRTVPFGDLAALERELAGGDVAAVVLEPVQGKTLRSLPPGDGRAVQELCRRSGALLVADEVQTGMGRTGTFLASDADGIEPDIVVLSKGMSGGFVPVGAVLVPPAIWSSTYSSMERAFVHSSTHHEGPLAMVALIATLEAIRDDRLVERAASLGTRIRERLRLLLASSPAAGEVRGRGLMIGIDLRLESVPGPWRMPLLTQVTQPLLGQALVADLCRHERLLAQVTGARRPTLKLLPPMVISEHDADWIERAVPQAIHRLGTGSAYRAIASAAFAVVRSSGAVAGLSPRSAHPVA